MLPSPKKVADAIRNSLFKSPEERREEKELGRDVQVRMGMTRIRRHIGHQKEMVGRLTDLAKQALKINDQERFRQVGKQLLWTRRDIQRWEKYILSLEMLQARRDQVRSSVDIMQAIKAMSESLSELAEPKEMAKLQLEMEKGLARATSLDERMEVMMGMMDSALDAGVPADEKALGELEASLSESVAAEEASAFESQIEEGLRDIRKELEEGKK